MAGPRFDLQVNYPGTRLGLRCGYCCPLSPAGLSTWGNILFSSPSGIIVYLFTLHIRAVVIVSCGGPKKSPRTFI